MKAKMRLKFIFLSEILIRIRNKFNFNSLLDEQF